jgi:hypothetical protein
MDMLRRSLVMGAVLAFALAMAAPASAGRGPSITYHGVFGGPVDYVGCTTEPPAAIASGYWNISLHGIDTATATVDIFTDGHHHVAFGGIFEQKDPTGGELFVVAIPTGAGPLTMSVTGDVMKYDIQPYDAFGLVCDDVTYWGTVTFATT